MRIDSSRGPAFADGIYLESNRQSTKQRDFKSVETNKYKGNQTQREILEMMSQVQNKSRMQDSINSSPFRSMNTEDINVPPKKIRISTNPGMNLKLSSPVETETNESFGDGSLVKNRTNKAKPNKISVGVRFNRTEEEEKSPSLFPTINENGDPQSPELPSPTKKTKKKNIIRPKKVISQPLKQLDAFDM